MAGAFEISSSSGACDVYAEILIAEAEVEAEVQRLTSDGTVDMFGNPANREKTGLWKASRFILGTECCERMVFYGISRNMLFFLKENMNQGNATAARNVAAWNGTCYMTPLLGAFIADFYLGKYWTIISFSTVYIMGMVLLTIFAYVSGLNPICEDGECFTTSRNSVLCFVSFYMIALGTGGIKPCVSSFGADQFDETVKIERIKKSSFFNWFYLSINIGALFGCSIMVWIEENMGYDLGFGILTAAVVISLGLFIYGRKLYRFDKVGGSPTRIFRVEELKSVVKLLPVCAVGIIYSTVYSQMITLFELQGRTMDLRLGSYFKIPAASMFLFDLLSVVIWTILYDKGIVSIARKFTGHENGLTELQRIGIGLVISICSMIVAGVLEIIRLDIIKKNENIPLSILWQVPQYLILGCADVFTFLAQSEFFYNQSSDSTRSICSALYLTTIAVGNYLSSLLFTIVMSVTTRNDQLGWLPDDLNRAHMDYFLWFLSTISIINFVIFLWIASRYNYKKVVNDCEQLLY